MMVRIRPVDETSRGEVELVAERMGETLVEVLGPERGGSMYTREWLVERVHDYARGGVVFVAEDAAIIGHAFARVEGDIGHFGTIYVVPSARRTGVATMLMEAIHAWLRERGVARVRYYTDEANAKLIALFERHGYRVVARDAAAQMVELAREMIPFRA